MSSVSKKIIKQLAVFSLLIGGLFLARLVFAQDFGTNAVSNGLNNALSNSDPRTIAGQIINIFLGLLGAIAVGIIVWSGYLWMTSRGDEEKISNAKKHLINGVIGLIIILSAWAIAMFILTRLSGAINNPGGSCVDGETQSCGCNGILTCTGGSWNNSPCIGSSCGCVGPNCGPVSCDSSPSAGCQAAPSICAPSNYCDPADCGCKPLGNVGDPCDTDLNNSTCDPDNNRCSEYLSCNPDTCLCFGPPVITEVSPVGGFCQENPNKSCISDSDCATTCNQVEPNGAPDNFITILGKNFGEYSPVASQVVFLGANSPQQGRDPKDLNPACISSWRDDQIVIAVPNSVTTGPIKVINKDNLSDQTDDNFGPQVPDFKANAIARPGLCYIDPNRGVLSSTVGYQGINLYSGSAYFGNYQSNVRGIDSQFVSPAGLAGTSTTPNIKAGDSGSFVINDISGNREKSNFLRFTKEREPGEGPYIVSFSPTSGNAGQYVTINGSGFGGARGNSHVYLGNVEASYDFPEVCLNSVWRDNQIVIKTPSGLTDGYRVISVNIGTTTIDTQRLNPNTFQTDNNLDLKTSLCKLEPGRGPAATPVVLWGEYFGNVGGEGLIKFNYNKSATGTIAADGRADKISTAVPNGAISGPVYVVKNNEWGNELNFEIGSCTVDSDCGTQICCPVATYKHGRCENTLAECYIDVPTSVFEWSFSTGFGNATNTNFYSCAGVAKYLGACQVNSNCPNVPGMCSPYAGGGKHKVADCDYSCDTVPGCNNLAPNNCTYDSTLDKCLKNGNNSNCNLDEVMTYTLGGVSHETTKTCNKDSHWEITVPGSCPTGWTRAAGNRCVDLASVCAICSAGFTCEGIANAGRCVSNKICPAGATCEDNPNIGQPDNCNVTDQPSCDCCCEIGQDARDCCAPLKCTGTCGSDTTDDNSGLGSCSGCAAVGTTPAEHDQACNCAGHSGQYCDINAAHPGGICSDCSTLSNQSNCNDHGAVCCVDAKRTSTTTDDICRGGNGLLISNDPSNSNYGYCAYYNCQSAIPTPTTPAGDPSLCATSTPAKIALYDSLNNCISGCAANPGGDYCSTFNGNQSACMAESACCFDHDTSDCKGGAKIVGGANDGYCAYYNCLESDPTLCNFVATTTGLFASTSTCAFSCANQQGGAGLSCANQAATSSCDTSVCNLPNFGCLTATGTLGIYPDCGACCCQPGLTPDSCVTPATPILHCQADRGNCSGAGRGLCCGCSKDSDCGHSSTVGCGVDTCCQARPEIASTSPEHLAANVCRNSVVQVSFNQNMDISSFNNNILLLEEREYGNGVCPSGTFITDSGSLKELLASQNKNFLVRWYQKIKLTLTRLTANFSGRALAGIPDPSKLYCAIPGTVTGEETGSNTKLIFAPSKLLAASANYYLVVLGDESLNSQSGMLSLAEIGFNGKGYLDPSNNNYVAGELIKFNNRAYKNSQIIKFTTLSDQSPHAGVCAIDHVANTPTSYLFKTTDNSIDENDSNPNNSTFDTKADKDKVFSAWAYSVDGQALQPVTGYFWDWNWQVTDPSIVAANTLPGLSPNSIFSSAQTGITDSETKLLAILGMDRFLNSSCDSNPNCICDSNNCSNNCCNVYSTGSGSTAVSDLYVFICNNPWPPVGSNGAWSPWNDTCQGAVGGPCANYNYKFYYCRDYGSANTLDDLPAIIDPAVIRGQSSNLICSADKTPCSGLGSTCGPDKNGDGNPDGVCVWNILKESYFFREVILPGGELTAATDRQTSGEVQVFWRSNSSQVGSYKVYYLKSGQGAMQFKEVTPSNACALVGSVYNCQAIISGLTNDFPYVFKVSVISANKTESQLSNEKTATPTDKTPPSVPINLDGQIVASSTVNFTWNILNSNNNDLAFFRLYHGLSSGQYGESFDSANGATSLSFNINQFVAGDNYFALSALDVSDNESAKSSEIIVTIPTN